MIGSNISKVMVFVFILLIKVGMAYAQAPVITLKKGPFNFPLDSSGNLTLIPSNVATITPDATNTNPTVLLRPSAFDCDTRGQQSVIITASDAPPPVTFNKPTGIVADAAGNFYITDAGNHKIRKISTTGDVTDFAGSGKVGIADGLGTLASFDTPQGIAIDATGNIFVTDVKAGLIRKITPAGLVSTIAGTAYSTANDQGTGFGVSFDEPYGIAIDKQGNMYVADGTADKIRRVTPNGNVTTFAGSGIQGFADGPSGEAEFAVPAGVAFDSAGNLFVADTYNNRIRKITPDGSVTTIAGDGIASLLDGTGTNANFYNPYNLIVDAKGNIYVADTQSDAIRKIDALNNVTTIAGNDKPGDVDGYNLPASPVVPQFNGPVGLAFDATGNLYVGDVNNDKIRKIVNNNTVSTFAGTGYAGETNGNLNPGNFEVAADTISIYIETNLKITTKYEDVTLATCIITMPDFVTANPPQTIDNCNNNIAAHQVPAVGTPLSRNSTIPVLIVVEDATGKYDTTSFNVYTGNFPIPPAVTIAASAQGPVCEGSSVTFTATTTHADTPSYQWQVNGSPRGTNDSTFTGVFNNGDTVICNIISTACSTPASSPPYLVSINTRPGISFPANLTIKNGSNIHLNPVITGDIQSYKWTPVDGLSNDTIANPVANPTKTTTYQLSIQSTTGCDTTVAVTITVIDNITIPNTFTPNGDGINDLWDINGLTLYPKCTISVYNRYGSLVYYSSGYTKPWNGTYNGSPLPIGTYYYVIDLKNGSAAMAGPVTILR